MKILNKMAMKTLCVVTMMSLSGLTFAGSDFASAWDAADTKRKEAGKIGAEWRDTGKLLKSAKKAAEEGDEAKAKKLVAQALEQSEDAIAQYAREDNLWMARVPQ